MDILVDYYNLPEKHRRKGVEYLVDSIVLKLLTDHVRDTRRIDMRLYGGWYENQFLTRDAQQIATDIMDFSPKVFVSPAPVRASVTVKVELAYSLKCDPQKHLWYTYRSKAVPRGIKCRDPKLVGCSDHTACPLTTTYYFFNRGTCPRNGCNIKKTGILQRGQQKLVDSMISSDMLLSAHLQSTHVAIVSSDDDFWPSIRTANLLGLTVFQIHTHESISTKLEYIDPQDERYISLNLWNNES